MPRLKSTLITTTLTTLALTLTPLASAATYAISDDTYLDSFSQYQRYNFGHLGAIKAVSNNGSGSAFPDTFSLTRTLLTLPTGFWSEIGSTAAPTATLSLRLRNNSLTEPGTGVVRKIEAYPLKQAFVAGTGGDPSASQVNSQTNPQPNNLSGTIYGSDWITYDGVNPWLTPGGDFDASLFSTSTLRTTAGVAYLDIDLSTLLRNPVTRNEIQANGLMLRITDESNYIGNVFASIWSGDTANAPTVTAIPTLPGDYNSDGHVDAADYTVWADSFGQTGPRLPADGNADGIVDAADYTIWADHFGTSTPGALTTAIPEPTAATGLVAIAALTLTRCRR